MKHLKTALYGAMAAMGVAGLGFAASAAAGHDAKAEHGEHYRVKKITIEHIDGTTKIIEPEKMKAHAMACRDEDGKFEADLGEEKAKDGKVRKSRIVICNKDKSMMLSALERTRARLADEDWGAKHRAEALARLDAQIARLKAESQTQAH